MPTIDHNLKMAALARQFFNKLSLNSSYKTLNTINNALLPRVLIGSTRFYSPVPTPHEVVDEKAEKELGKGIIAKVNEQVADKKEGRLFAVLHVAGKQWRVTEGDVIVVEGYWPPTTPDRISLNKVLLVGGTDFTLIGRPLVQRGLVNVEATVIEKTLSHTKTHFKFRKRKQYRRIHFVRAPHTMLRINKVEINGKLNNPPEVSDSTSVYI